MYSFIEYSQNDKNGLQLLPQVAVCNNFLAFKQVMAYLWDLSKNIALVFGPVII